jgi:hypothetical protein
LEARRNVLISAGLLPGPQFEAIVVLESSVEFAGNCRVVQEKVISVEPQDSSYQAFRRCGSPSFKRRENPLKCRR